MMRWTFRTKQSGFGLIEVLITTVVLGVGLVGTAKFQGQEMHGNATSKARLEALNLARQQLETLRGEYLDDPEFESDVVTGQQEVTGSNAVFDLQWIVSKNDAPEYKDALVTVSWIDTENDPQSVKLSSFLQSYVPEKSGDYLKAKYVDGDGGDSGGGGDDGGSGSGDKGSGDKKSDDKKSSGKKSGDKKSDDKKSSGKKSGDKKSDDKKSSGKKSGDKKSDDKKSSGKKSGDKKSSDKGSDDKWSDDGYGITECATTSSDGFVLYGRVDNQGANIKDIKIGGQSCFVHSYKTGKSNKGLTGTGEGCFSCRLSDTGLTILEFDIKGGGKKTICPTDDAAVKEVDGHKVTIKVSGDTEVDFTVVNKSSKCPT